MKYSDFTTEEKQILTEKIRKMINRPFVMTPEKRQEIKNSVKEYWDNIHTMMEEGYKGAVHSYEFCMELALFFDDIIEYMESFPKGGVFTIEEISIGILIEYGYSFVDDDISLCLYFLHDQDAVIFDPDNKTAILVDKESRDFARLWRRDINIDMVLKVFGSETPFTYDDLDREFPRFNYQRISKECEDDIELFKQMHTTHRFVEKALKQGSIKRESKIDGMERFIAIR